MPTAVPLCLVSPPPPPLPDLQRTAGQRCTGAAAPRASPLRAPCSHRAASPLRAPHRELLYGAAARKGSSPAERVRRPAASPSQRGRGSPAPRRESPSPRPSREAGRGTTARTPRAAQLARRSPLRSPSVSSVCSRGPVAPPPLPACVVDEALFTAPCLCPTPASWRTVPANHADELACLRLSLAAGRLQRAARNGRQRRAEHLREVGREVDGATTAAASRGVGARRNTAACALLRCACAAPRAAAAAKAVTPHVARLQKRLHSARVAVPLAGIWTGSGALLLRLLSSVGEALPARAPPRDSSVHFTALVDCLHAVRCELRRLGVCGKDMGLLMTQLASLRCLRLQLRFIGASQPGGV
eukprot:TRINITY_DN29609_c0_g1_i1.p2 TRINITY_DN29609_c0_g1~~TRINITY_DN29609_c0_g1_i1.p2  ORF type:complete len:375 (+),score=100.74 TRINITY_DN29609_c0_g1_i1:52-1125(+)